MECFIDIVLLAGVQVDMQAGSPCRCTAQSNFKKKFFSRPPPLVSDLPLMYQLYPGSQRNPGGFFFSHFLSSFHIRDSVQENSVTFQLQSFLHLNRRSESNQAAGSVTIRHSDIRRRKKHLKEVTSHACKMGKNSSCSATFCMQVFSSAVRCSVFLTYRNLTQS